MENLKTEIKNDVFYVYNITPENEYLLKIPENIKIIHIFGYYLDHFSIPKNIKDIEINYIGLKTLYIPDGIESVKCSKNFLKTIEIPQSLITLIANKNLLSEITFRLPNDNQLEYLDIRSNILTKLDFNLPDNLNFFNAAMNKINYISPKIRNYLTMQYLPAPESSDSSDDEEWYQKVLSKSI